MDGQTDDGRNYRMVNVDCDSHRNHRRKAWFMQESAEVKSKEKFLKRYLHDLKVCLSPQMAY